MDEQQARVILQVFRPGTQDEGDPHFADALQEVARNPQLARWFAEEQAFDQATAAHLEAVPAPFGLKTRILAQAAPPAASWRWSWAVKLAGAAALLFLLLQVVSLFRPAVREAQVSNYARDMVSLIRRGGGLDMESDDLGKIQDWLAQKEITPMEIPANLAALEPVGCRILSFRGQKVTLICFHRGGDQLAHLFVVDRAALPRLKPGAAPVFQSEGEWTTASWADGDNVYMIAAQGDRATLQRFLPHA